MSEGKKKKSGKLSTIILIVVFVIGLSLLVYPSLSNYWNSMHQTRAIAGYTEKVTKISQEEYDAMWHAAEEYNKKLAKSKFKELTAEEEAEYETLLNVNNDGVMGYIEIPEIDVSLPIYHGTSDSVLQVAAGHINWSSLPTGGINNHCVLSGHRGLPSAKLFTDLDRLMESDVFVIRILNEVFTYEIDQIRIVEPNNISDLQIIPGQDLCTLVTCTPYGINSHRMLVRGHRVENAQEAAMVRITADAIQIEPLIVAPIMAIPMLVLLIVIVYLKDWRRNR